jgi:outer membrane protein OmpA-like peptidoglycan-associated protein
VTMAVQRYKTVKSGDYGSTRDATAGAQAPFTLAGDEITPKARPGGKAGFGMSYDVTTPASPPLLVADDDSLAINAQEGEPKEFYADAQVIQNANQVLENLSSPVDLNKAGNKVTVPDGKGGAGKELVMVQPLLRNEAAPGLGKFAALCTDICRDVAKSLLGGISHAKLGKGAQGVKVPIETSSGTVITGTHSLAEGLAQGNVSVPEAATRMGSHADPAAGKAYGTGLTGGTVRQHGKDLGINEEARAGVGEGYVTQTIASAADEGGTKKDYSKGGQVNEFVWGYHFSSVVAQSLDGADQIAMENYARKADLIAGQKALLAQLQRDFAAQINGLVLAGEDKDKIGAILHRLDTGKDPTLQQATQAYQAMVNEQLGNIKTMWYFRMIGTKAGQSFHEQMAATRYFANPPTLAVGHYDRSKPLTISFTSGSSQLEQIWKNNLVPLAKDVKADVHQGRNITLQITGYDEPGLFVKSRATQRADAVKAFLVQEGLGAGLIQTVNGGSTKKFGKGAANCKAEIAIV